MLNGTRAVTPPPGSLLYSGITCWLSTPRTAVAVQQRGNQAAAGSAELLAALIAAHPEACRATQMQAGRTPQRR